MDWKKIESRTNPAVKFAASLSDKKARDREGVFPAEGVTLFSDFCKMGFFPQRIYLSEDAACSKEDIEKEMGDREAEAFLLSPSSFERVTSEKGSQGIFCVYSTALLSEVLPLDKAEKLIALERVQDPGNVGTIIRTAAAFGFDGVLLVSCADPFGPKTVRATMGALGRIPIRSFPSVEDLFSFLRENEVKTVATCLSPDSLPISRTDLSGRVCILIGNEGKGLSPRAVEGADVTSVVPIENMESLNAAAAAAVFMWEVKRRREQLER